jgi:uncharacterized protein (DUF111 family)
VEDRYGDTVTVFETDMDHISGEIMGDVAGLLMEKGALDVSWTPIFMKKGRPGYRLTVIAPLEKFQVLGDLIMIHTRTLGMRVQTVERIIAEREVKHGNFLGHKVSEKRCAYKGRSFSKMENDDVVRIAKKEGVPVIDIIERYGAEKGKKRGK